MVTTINPESAGLAGESLDFTISGLQKSELPEEQKLFEQAVAVLQSLLSKLKPIAKYLTAPTMTVDGTLVHIVFVATLDEPYLKEALFLDSRGEFIGGQLIEETVFKETWAKDSGPEWYVKLDDLFKSLLSLLTMAVKRREQFLAAIEKRRKLLEEISCLIHMKEKSD